MCRLLAHRHVGRVDAAGALGERCRGQQRRQHLTGQRATRPQIGGLGHAPARLAAVDPQPVRQSLRQWAAQLV